MKTVNILEAKTHLSRLVEEAAQGNEVVIAKAGKPLAVLSAWSPASSQRQGGGWAGKVWISEDFDSPDLEIEGLFGLPIPASETLKVAEEPAAFGEA